jgi:hypothetical protein
MRIRGEIARKHWLNAAIEETRRQYLDQGYKVRDHARLGDHEADMIATRGKEHVVLEFKSGPWSASKEQQAAGLRNYVAHKLGGRFVLVWAPPPVERQIEVTGLEAELCSHLMENLPAELDELSTHTRVEAVSDLEITSIHLEPGSTQIHGSALVEVDLQYGSDSDVDHDEGGTTSDSFPFEFILGVDDELKITQVEKLEIDTSGFYE